MMFGTCLTLSHSKRIKCAGGCALYNLEQKNLTITISVFCTECIYGKSNLEMHFLIDLRNFVVDATCDALSVF